MYRRADLCHCNDSTAGRARSLSQPSVAHPSPPERATLHRNVQAQFPISTTYSTIATKALSFQGQVLTGVTPLQLAQNGLYHQPHQGFGGLACCFACQSAQSLYIFQRAPFEEVQQIHLVDCIWQAICRDLQHHFETPTHSLTQPPHHLRLDSHLLAPIFLRTGNNSKRLPYRRLQYTVSNPINTTVPTIVEKYSNTNLDPVLNRHPSYSIQNRIYLDNLLSPTSPTDTDHNSLTK
ncbi:hypothetical protein PENARI_c033G04043 [Penicillium arizonense]|uniref:Uncharacterized protein n=1 Tax=Penicillium arizonense TaxID=1835702 RepID=A0A1F5L527_PENAI|nr:hypothetical protein PENARI_c033G04043 [Penicillium arizonense]OGE48021.1 hypothetical protein PENARI_c033G04043 [Penicillium arizonense]